MKNVLHIISSARGSRSYSQGLSSAIVKKLTDKRLVNTIVERNLAADFPPFIDRALIEVFYKNPGTMSNDDHLLLQYANAILNEIKNADFIVIGTPVHNLGISAPLKAWIDQLIRFGVTYGYHSDGQRTGYLGGKKVFLAIASGGKVSDSDGGSDYTEPYLKSVFNAYTGITDFCTYRIEGTASPDFRENYEEILKNL
ncbi:FMN-dependent NADH-azoreductase [Pedobacter sp. MC2016-24]|uniref:FMN-dependent NADH-azoreductase n=1 Tax=Pedobacter sp. MC2016-24 TaxID=2780090 RepID=UPI00187FB29C|nr:NAD(P)H-dependent oxidoreductase [Pedobacter sp. MC2016-24]MBE9600759.1 NAD(P)H-dependent oxidoreductase [Pedobacter sp. MC2016-24]